MATTIIPTLEYDANKKHFIKLSLHNVFIRFLYIFNIHIIQED